MKKQFIALIAAVLMTICVGGSMLAISGIALFNPNGTKAVDTQGQISQVQDSNVSQQSQIQQLQSLISQYQAREKEYQAREDQLRQQLDQANTQAQQAQEQSQQQLQQIQSLLNALQQRGLITVTSDGRIIINN